MRNLKTTLPKYFFLVFCLLVTASFLEIVNDFLLSVFWAVVLSILFYKTYERILNNMPRYPNQAAGLTVVLILLIGIIPVTATVFALINQTSELIEMQALANKEEKSEKEDKRLGDEKKSKKDDKKISDEEKKSKDNDKSKDKEDDETSFDDRVEDFRDRIPIKKSTLKALGFSKKKTRKKVKNAIEDAAEAVLDYVIDLTQNLFKFIGNFFLTIYLLFFFLRDGPKMVADLMRVIPMEDELELRLMRRFESVTRATIKGSLIVAILQGLAGGLLFWAIGIESVLIWTILMILASLFPIGSVLIWGPWAISFFIDGEIMKGIILIVVGTAFIGMIDNLLRPRLVGKDTRMPDYLVLLSTLGGLAYFGLSGFVIGPVAAALFMSCWNTMGKEYGE